jgi:hypothetical protein
VEPFHRVSWHGRRAVACGGSNLHPASTAEAPQSGMPSIQPPTLSTGDDPVLQLRETRQLLVETIDYLERLPPVPVTREFCKRLRARLDAKPVKLAAAVRSELHGKGPYSPAGLPLLEVTLTADLVAKLRIPTDLHGATRAFAVERLGQMFKGGEAVAIQLDERQVVAGQGASSGSGGKEG